MAPLNLYLNLRLISFDFRFKKLIKIVNTIPTTISPTLYTNWIVSAVAEGRFYGRELYIKSNLVLVIDDTCRSQQISRTLLLAQTAVAMVALLSSRQVLQLLPDPAARQDHYGRGWGGLLDPPRPTGLAPSLMLWTLRPKCSSPIWKCCQVKFLVQISRKLTSLDSRLVNWSV